LNLALKEAHSAIDLNSLVTLARARQILYVAETYCPTKNSQDLLAFIQNHLPPLGQQEQAHLNIVTAEALLLPPNFLHFLRNI
jgi:hypothetical protein